MNYPCVQLGLLRGLHGKDLGLTLWVQGLAQAMVSGVFLKPLVDRDRV